MTTAAVDPRAWNLLAGLCVASSCGGRPPGADASGTDTTEDSESESESSAGTLETGEPECITDSDCAPSYYCLNGICEYESATDEAPEPECMLDAECDALEVCDYDQCLPIESPPSCDPPDPAPVLQIPVASLGMTFADVDADGAEELVIATQTELHVYESGSDVPRTSPRGLESDIIHAMVGGPFDALPGDDVMILIADELRQHDSDGMGNFAAPSVSATPSSDSTGLRAGEFDGQDPADLLIWGHTGADVRLGSGDEFPLSDELVVSASARSLDDPVGGFVLQHDTMLHFFTASGSPIDTAQVGADAPFVVTSIEDLGDGFDLSSSVVNLSWTMIEEWGPATGNAGARWGFLGRATAIAGGDFDGDSHSDAALIVDASVQVLFNPRDDDSCLALYPFAAVAQGLAVGDHDGDGDDELAIWFDAAVSIIDAE